VYDVVQSNINMRSDATEYNIIITRLSKNRTRNQFTTTKEIVIQQKHNQINTENMQKA